jgi:methylmalonyl-CoA mutase
MGPSRQHKARANFTTEFFEAGGFEMLNNDGFETFHAAAQAALDSNVSAVVICSTDEMYPDLVPPLVGQIKSAKPGMIVILAGYPQDQIEAHRAAGIDEFIHLRANCYEINHWLQQQIGVLDHG